MRECLCAWKKVYSKEEEEEKKESSVNRSSSFIKSLIEYIE